MLSAPYRAVSTPCVMQLEAFIETVLLKLAEGKGIIRIEQQEAALEVRGRHVHGALISMGGIRA